MSTTTNVNLITSAASLLSGDLEECLTPDDETCEKGIASVLAYARNYTVNAETGEPEPIVVIQTLDKNSPMVNMHPLLWVVNRVILHNLFGFNLFISPPSILLQNAIDSSVSRRDISDLQSFQMPLLISNVELSLSNSWYPYTKAIHFDKDNGLAITYIHGSNVPFTIDHVTAVKGILNYIHKLNTENGCFQTINNGTSILGNSTTLGGTAYQQYIAANPLFSHPGTELELGNDEFGNVTVLIPDTFDDPPTREELVTETNCWISVILYADAEMNYWPFLEEIVQHSNPPNLILNLEETYETFPIPELYNNTNVWVGHCPMDDEIYCQHRITLNQDENGRDNRIVSVSFINASLAELPSDFKDDVWDTHIRKLRILADEAQANNPVIGYSGFFPVAREDTYRQCQGGECQIGNLFTDAIRWFTDTDVAFTSSGGYRGPGWPEGEVRLTDIYAGLPFPNTPCVGKEQIA
jgi:5'-nucleotidase, C-terminal domain